MKKSGKVMMTILSIALVFALYLCASLNGQKKHLAGELEKANASVNALKQEKTSLTDEHAAALAALQAEKDEVDAALIALQDEKAAADAALIALQAEKAAADAAFIALQDEKTAADAEHAVELAALEEEIKESANAAAAADADHAAALAELADEKNALLAQIDAQKADVQKLEADLKTAEKELDTEKAAHGDTAAVLDTVTKEKADLESTIDDLNAQLLSATAQSEDLIVQINNVKPIVRHLLYVAAELKMEMRVYEGQTVICKMRLPLKGDAYAAMLNAAQSEQADHGSLMLVKDTEGFEETHELQLDIEAMRQLLLMME